MLEEFFLKETIPSDAHFALKTAFQTSKGTKIAHYLQETEYLNELYSNILKQKDIGSLVQVVEKWRETKTAAQRIITTHVSTLLFIRENVVGPSLFAQEENYFENFNCPSLDDKIIQELSISGESIYNRVKMISLVFVAQIIATDLSLEEDQQLIEQLLQARLHYLHHRLLSNNTLELQEKCIKLYGQALKGMGTLGVDDETHANIWIEYSRCLLSFYKYKESEEALEQARALLKLKVKLTGKMGRRSKYSQKSSPQLVLDVESEEVKIKPPEVDLVDQPQNVLLDEESILLEKPKLDEEETKESLEQITTIQIQSLILGNVNYLTRGEAKDETNREVIQAYLERILDKSLNWLVFSQALLERSRNEFHSTKKRERSMLQMQTLVDQYKDEKPGTWERTLYFFNLGYPCKWEMVKELAQDYMQMGVFMSAFEMLKEVELWEECVECLFLSGKKTKAKQLAKDILSKNPNNPGVLCTLGEIEKNDAHFRRAWEVSKGKYGRAMRCLGKSLYAKNQLDEAILCLEKATKLNTLYSNPWFLLGCGYMRLKNWKKAVYAFGNVLTIDQSQSDAWSNMASCFMQMTQKEVEALLCIEQAVKIRRTSWKLWENLQMLAIQTDNLNKSIWATKELLQIEQGKQRLKTSTIAHICEIYFKLVESKEHDESYLEFERIKVRGFLLHLTQHIAKDPSLWSLFADFVKMAEYEQVKQQDEKQEKGAEIIELEMKCLTSMMVPSWEKQKPICERIKRQVEGMNQQIIGSHGRAMIPLGEERKKDILEYFQTVAKKLKQEHDLTIDLS